VRRGALLLVAAAACGEPAGPVAAPQPLRNEAPPPAGSAGPRELPIEQIPGLAFDEDADAKQDCRPSQVARRRFAGIAMRACGPFDPTAGSDWEHARDYTWVAAKLRPRIDCAVAAIAAQRPFILEERVPGTDSAVADSVVGVLEHGKLVVYSLRYDSNPCGGGCPDRGHTDVYRCEQATSEAPAATCAQPAECFHCGLETVDACAFGRRTP
jgi:hypothetical protein